MKYQDVIGLSKVKDQLRQMVATDRLPHALLLLGPKGCGKLALALVLAQELLCTESETEGSCGRCASCIKASKLVHPDLHFSFPTVGTNVNSDHFLGQWRTQILDNPYFDLNHWLQLIGAENKQGNINKAECVRIIQKLGLKTFESHRKVLVMWLPEFLGKEGNRLLKIIEEPPEGTHFILVAENPELILNTILSRCQLVKVAALSDEEIKSGLVERAALKEDEAQKIAVLSEGNFSLALELATQKENDNANRFLNWMRKCYLGNGVEMVQWGEQFATLGREKQKYFVQYALHFMREFLVMKLTGIEQIRLQEKEKKTASNLTKIMDWEEVDQIVPLLNDAYYHIERNANPKILFLDVSINMHNILRKKVKDTPIHHTR